VIKHMVKRQTARGFSLIGVIVAMQISLMAALIAAPRVSALYGEYQLMSASNLLAFEVARARMQAVGKNRIVRIRMASPTQYVRETSTNGTTWTGQVTAKLPTGVTASSPAEVRFDKRGFPTVNDSITVTNRISQSKTVSTNLVGVVSVG
jgi:Tfp pilus assembly protein FimT